MEDYIIRLLLEHLDLDILLELIQTSDDIRILFPKEYCLNRIKKNICKASLRIYHPNICLLFAVKENRLDLAKYFVENKANKFVSPFKVACFEGYLDIVKYLLPLNEGKLRNFRRFGIMNAIIGNQIEVLDFLINDSEDLGFAIGEARYKGNEEMTVYLESKRTREDTGEIILGKMDSILLSTKEINKMLKLLYKRVSLCHGREN